MVEVRDAVADDEVALRTVDLENWSPLASPGPPRDPEWRFFGERVRPDEVQVATVAGEVVGYVILQQPRLPSQHHVLVVNGLAVLPAHQRRGIGRRLVEAAQRRAVARGGRRVTLRVLGTNPHAQQLYESCGFEVEGVLREEFRLDGRWVDDVLMAWRVPTT